MPPCWHPVFKGCASPAFSVSHISRVAGATWHRVRTLSSGVSGAWTVWEQLWLSSQAPHRGEKVHFKTKGLLKLKSVPRVGPSLL